VPVAFFLSTSPTGNVGSQTKLEQRHTERLQAKVTVVMAFAADSPPGFPTSLFLALTADRNLLRPDLGSLAAPCSCEGGLCVPGCGPAPNWGQLGSLLQCQPEKIQGQG